MSAEVLVSKKYSSAVTVAANITSMLVRDESSGSIVTAGENGDFLLFFHNLYLALNEQKPKLDLNALPESNFVTSSATQPQIQPVGESLAPGDSRLQTNDMPLSAPVEIPSLVSTEIGRFAQMRRVFTQAVDGAKRAIPIHRNPQKAA